MPDITVLDAINWVHIAWGNVRPCTITKCFRRSGFGDSIQVDEIEIPLDTFGFENFITEQEALEFTNFDNTIGEFFFVSWQM